MIADLNGPLLRSFRRESDGRHVYIALPLCLCDHQRYTEAELVCQWCNGAVPTKKEIADQLAILRAPKPVCICEDVDGMALYSENCPNSMHANRARTHASKRASTVPVVQHELPEAAATLRAEHEALKFEAQLTELQSRIADQDTYVLMLRKALADLVFSAEWCLAAREVLGKAREDATGTAKPDGPIV